MSNTASGQPANPQNDSEISSHSAHSIEHPEQTAQQGTTLSAFGAAGLEQINDHQVISTGTYYQAEPQAFDDYSGEEGQGWETDGETGEM